MTEQGSPVEFVGIGKPDGLPTVEPLDKARDETHPAVGAVKQAVAGWWERVGPGGVEKQWVSAHKNILANIKETERYAAFDATAETWRKVGKFFGIASTVVDFSVSGVGLVSMGYGLWNPGRITNTLGALVENSNNAWLKSQFGALSGEAGSDVLSRAADRTKILQRSKMIGRAASLVPGVGAAGIALGVGPAHNTWSLGAKVAEFFGVAVAKAENYVGTGKAAEHAEAVGEVLDKGFKVIAKNPEIVPEKYRKTVEIIAEASEKEEQARKAAELQRRIQEKANLQREYQTWKDTMDPGEKSYFDQNGGATMDDFLKKRTEFQKDQAKQEQKAREKRE